MQSVQGPICQICNRPVRAYHSKVGLPFGSVPQTQVYDRCPFEKAIDRLEAHLTNEHELDIWEVINVKTKRDQLASRFMTAWAWGKR